VVEDRLLKLIEVVWRSSTRQSSASIHDCSVEKNTEESLHVEEDEILLAKQGISMAMAIPEAPPLIILLVRMLSSSSIVSLLYI